MAPTQPARDLPPDTIRIADLVGQLGQRIRTGRQQSELKAVEWEALRFLARANRFSRNPGGIAAGLAITKGAASQTVAALARLGLVLRLPDPLDGRGLALDLTNGGRRMVEADPLMAVAAAIAALPAPALAQTAATLRAALAGAAGHRGAGECGTCRHFGRDAARGESAGPHRCNAVKTAINDAETLQACVLYAASPPVRIDR
ncbi:MAG: helix-turn-helix domain-containing protein [Dongiaceae bacterium]